VVDWAFRIDTLTVVMLVVVNTVSALVHLYSIGYMAEDRAGRASSPICRCSPSPC
jgi:NADH:ubiquinone oxidoreductase subunit 5 (subunit L)/multisubunit Na+/H+ antiporter MnhA subunit